MASVDRVANVLTKIRNASRARHATVEVPASKSIERILTILRQEGFIRNFKPVGHVPTRRLRIYLKYAPDKRPVVTGLVVASTPGSRRYCGADELPRVLGGLGRAILTTSKGVMTDHEARRQRVGGEVLCYVW